MALKGRSKASFLIFTSARGGVWFITFFIQVCMNYLNIYLVEDRAVGGRAATRARVTLRASPGVGAQKKTSEVRQELLLSIRAPEKGPASLLLLEFISRR